MKLFASKYAWVGLAATLLFSSACTQSQPPANPPAGQATASPGGVSASATPAGAGSPSTALTPGYRSTASPKGHAEFPVVIRQAVDGPDGSVVIVTPDGNATIEKKGDQITLTPPPGQGKPETRSVADMRSMLALGEVQACGANLKNIGTALEMYASDNAGRYPSTLNALVPKMLAAVPACPAAGKDTYSSSLQTNAAPDAFTVVCEGDYHKAAQAPANYPQYNSTAGLVLPPGAAPAGHGPGDGHNH